MRRLAVLAIAACSARSSTPREAPREVFSAYHLGGLRIEGAPPIDPVIAKAWDAQPSVDPARLIDMLGNSVMVGARGRCMTFHADGSAITGLAQSCGPGAWWGSLRSGDSDAYLVEDEAEQSTLYFGRDRVDLPAGRITDPVWSPKRDVLVFGFAPAAAPVAAELWVWRSQTGARKLIGDGPWAPLDVSSDGTLALVRYESSTKHQVLYQVELATAATRQLSAPDAATPLARFAPDGDVVAVTDAGSDHRHLERFATGRSNYRGPRVIDDLPGEITQLAVAPSGVAVVVVSTLGQDTSWIVDQAGTHEIKGAPIRDQITDLHATDDRIAFTYSSSTQPREVRIGALAYRGDEWSLTPQIAWPGDPPPTHLVSFVDDVRASDGVESEVLLDRPPGTARVPVVIEFHSGPEDRWHRTYDSFAQLLVARGYAVVRPNVRGSTEQGRTFEAADDGAHRADVLLDVRATLDWIAKRPDLDASRVIVAGTSYGGYLALAAVIAFPDRIRGAATLSPITDFVGFLEGTAPYRQDHRRAEYGDERIPELRDFLTKLSPLTHVGELKRPILVAYGQRDPRVPPATTEHFVRQARAAGKTVWSIAAADEGHWFEGPENRRAFEILTVQFLDAVGR